MRTFNNMNQAWLHIVKELHNDGEKVLSRNGNAVHLTDYSFTLTDPTKNLVSTKHRGMSVKYSVAELYWYGKETNTTDFIDRYAKMWRQIANDDGTVNSNYGYLLAKHYGFNQVRHVIELLSKDPQSRQAVMHFKFASNKTLKDTPCTLSMQFTVFKGKLNAHVYMRSNDIWFGTPYDILFFTLIQQKVARQLNLPLGNYTHTVGDIHVYEKHYKKINFEELDNDPAESHGVLETDVSMESLLGYLVGAEESPGDLKLMEK